MGCNTSKPEIFTDNAGDGNDFLDRYSVGNIIGKGEFGVVKLIYDKEDPNGAISEPFACKILRKGRQFKDNTLYSPIKPKVLRLECKILKTLAGKHYNVNLHAVYESPSNLYIITDYCAGGDMFHYIAENYGAGIGDKEHGDEVHGLRTEDVSRISFQLLDAVSHCARYGIIHRDIKPENIMFKEGKKGSPLQLIDFGSGTMTNDYEVLEESKPEELKQSDGTTLSMLTTFAGSAFYISPEMFKRKYTCKTDVWSAGVTIYVLVAGYPFMDLQKAFNSLQNSEAKTDEERIMKLKELPNMPVMPDTFFEILAKCLNFRHKKRTSAEKILGSEFIRFHRDHEVKMERTSSVIVEGASRRHYENRQYGIYERSVTALLVSVLSRKELKRLLDSIDSIIASSPEEHVELATNKKRLQIIRVQELIDILKDLEIDTDEEHMFVLLEQLAHGIDYLQYAYHVAILRQFYTYDEEETSHEDTLDNSLTRKLDFALKRDTKLDQSQKSEGDMAFLHSIHSVHGVNNWDMVKKKVADRKNELNSSSHF